MKLLTLGEASPKLSKDQRYMTAILYLASASYRKELCPNAGHCVETCLVVKAGRAAIGGPDNTIQRARKRRTDWLYSDREGFISQLNSEILALKKKAQKKGMPLAIRLNGGSDLDWSDIYTIHPDVQYWEYTKRPDLAIKLSALPNVHITYSYNERTTSRLLMSMIEHRINVAMVFDIRKGKPLPAKVGTLPVIDGDTSDLRFLDEKGVIVGLRLKSLRKVDTSTSKFIQKVA